MNNAPSKPRGSALMLTVIMMTSMLVVSLAVGEMMLKNVKTAAIATRSVPAYLAGESGAERMLWEVRKNGIDGTYNFTRDGAGVVTFNPTLTFTTATVRTVTRDVTVGGIPTTFATSTGMYLGSQRSVVTEFDQYE